MNQEPKSLEEELDGSDKSPSLQDCLKVPGNAIQMPVPLLLHLLLDKLAADLCDETES